MLDSAGDALLDFSDHHLVVLSLTVLLAGGTEGIFKAGGRAPFGVLLVA